MAKFTAKYVRTGLVNCCGVDEWKNLVVKDDDDESFFNVACEVAAVARAIDAAFVFEAKFPEGIGDYLEDLIAEWEALRAKLQKTYPKDYKVFAKMFEIVPADVDTDEAGEDDDEEDEEPAPPPVKVVKGGKKQAKKPEPEEEDELPDDDEEEEAPPPKKQGKKQAKKPEPEDDDELPDDLDSDSDELEDVLDSEFENEVLDSEEDDDTPPPTRKKTGGKRRR